MVSDNLKHDKTVVIIFTDQILSLKATNAKIVNIWSDGPSSQFKNRFVFKALDFLTGKHCIIINWNFLATSHGKGPVDSVGAGHGKRQRINCASQMIWRVSLQLFQI